jgi:hypothetical protein
LFELLGDWVEKPGKAGREVSAKELYGELQESAPDKRLPFKNSVALGKYLSRIIPMLKEYYDIEIVSRRSNVKAYKFLPKAHNNILEGVGLKNGIQTLPNMPVDLIDDDQAREAQESEDDHGPPF